MSGDEQSGKPDNATPESPALSPTPPQGVRSQRKDTLLGVGIPQKQKEKEPESEEPPLLPGTKTEYSAPRALPAAQRDADLGPSSTIEVAATAHVSSVVREEEPEATAEERAASARLDTLPPKARISGGRNKVIAFGVLGAGCVVLLGAAFMRFAGGSGHVVSGSSAVRTEVAPLPGATTASAPAEQEPTPPPAETTEPSAPTVAPVAHALDDLPPAPEPEAEGEPEATAAPVVAHAAAPKHAPSLPKNDAPAAAKPAAKPAPARTNPPKTAAGGSIVRESPF